MPNEPNSKNIEKMESKSQEQLNYLIDDVDVMTNYVTASGKILSQEVNEGLSELNCFRDEIYHIEKDPKSCLKWFSLVLKIHSHLSKLIAPVTPTSLRATERIGKSFRIKNPAINILIYITLMSLVGFVLTYIPFSNSNNVKQMYLMLNLLFASGLGAGFYSLTKSRRYILQRTFDPRYNQAYYIRFVLGLAAGTILGYFGTKMLTGSLAKELGPGLLSIIGGFSADAVSQILERLAETLVTMVRGSNQDEIDAKERQAKMETTQALMQSKNETAKKLYKILDKAQGDNMGEIRSGIENIINEVFD